MNFDSRETLSTRYRENYGDMLSLAKMKNTTLARVLQEESPFPDDDNDCPSALGSILARNHIILRDDAETGVRSSSAAEIFDSERPHLAPAFAHATKAHILNKFQGYNTLATTASEFNPGSAIRPYSDSPLRDPEKIRAFPPLSDVAASVISQPEDSIRVIEYKASESGETPVEISEYTDIPLDEVHESEFTGSMKILAGGLKISQKLRNSRRFTAEMMMHRADKYATRLEREMVTDCLKAVRQGLSATSLGTLSVANLIKMVTTPDSDKDYRITTVIGLTDAIQKYLALDRSSLWANSEVPTVAGGVIGQDVYPGAVTRRVYDVKSGRGVANNQLLAFDASDTVDVYILEGSERGTDTYVERNRSYEIAWDIEYGAQLRAPSAVGGRWLFTIS